MLLADFSAIGFQGKIDNKIKQLALKGGSVELGDQAHA
jgi:hypothetical protein